MNYSFDELNPLSRLWVFQSDRLLSTDEVNLIEEELARFISTWATHGVPLSAAFTINNNCAALVAVDESIQAASGCSISSLTSLFETIGNKIGVSFFDRFSIAFKNEEKHVVCSVNDFKDFIKSGLVTETSLVYNNLVSVKQDLETKWELPLMDSWQKRYLN